MVEKIDGGVELLLDPQEAELFDRQVKARDSGDVSKSDAEYQNTPHDAERCAGCSMFVPGFPYPVDVGGYCSKVKSFKGPLGMIFEDGWCKFFESSGEDDPADISDLDDDIPA